MSIIISPDEIKKELKHYSPEQAESFHSQSAKIADKRFEQELKANTYTEVVLMSGGSASGKTEFLYTQLHEGKSYLIYDGTLSNPVWFENKFRQIKMVGAKLAVYAVIPDSLQRAFNAFLNRDRKFQDKHFYKTHSLSRKLLLSLAQDQRKIKINIIESSYTVKQELKFAKLAFTNRKELVDYLTRIQISEDDIITQVTSGIKS